MVIRFLVGSREIGMICRGEVRGLFLCFIVLGLHLPSLAIVLHRIALVLAAISWFSFAVFLFYTLVIG